MKATLATLACLLTVGFLSAASVEGNNTAVVIRKNVVKSDTGWQFLCVPVDGLKIDGTATTIDLETLLPAATLVKGTQVKIDTETYTIGDNGQWSANPSLSGGTIFWVKEPNADTNPLTQANPTSLAALLTNSTLDDNGDETTENPNTANTNTTIVFCGQDRARTAQYWSALSSGVMTPLKNDSSVAITLDAAAELATGETRTNDQILTIQEGSAEYKSYFYRNGKWYSGKGVMKPVTTPVIAPGEAFYYYKAAANNE